MAAKRKWKRRSSKFLNKVRRQGDGRHTRFQRDDYVPGHLCIRTSTHLCIYVTAHARNRKAHQHCVRTATVSHPPRSAAIKSTR
eukprot:6208873-Pleurochrysis_carterae.AAC.5